MKIFILDDKIDQFPRVQIVKALAGHDLTISRDAFEARETYESRLACGGWFDLLLLAHDLRKFPEDSEGENTGYQFVKWLVGNTLKPKPRVILHSQNPIGRGKMALLLHEYNFSVLELAFGTIYVNYLKETYGQRRAQIIRMC